MNAQTDSTPIALPNAGLQQHRPDIQGLRAIAVLAVVAFHAGLPVPGGFLGVDVFFVISGFVITLMLRREWVSTGRIRLGVFYKRRFLRLAPALALMICFTLIASAFVLSPFGAQVRAAQTAIGAEFSVANFVIAFTTGGYFDLIAQVNPLLHTWSLSVEEQFYFVFPGILLLTWLLARRFIALKALPVFVLSVGILGTFALALVGITGWTPKYGASLLSFYSPFTRAWEFGLGALLALGIAGLSRVPRVTAQILGPVGALMMMASFWLINERTPVPGPWTLLPVLGTLALIGAGSIHRNLISDSLSMRGPAAVGDWSYSIYLWHWPFIVLATLLWPSVPFVGLIAAVVSFAPALVSFRFLESRIRVMRAMRWRGFTILVILTLVPTVVLALGLKVGSDRGWGNPRIQEAQTASASAANGLPMNCMSFLTIKGLTDSDLSSCVFNSDANGAPIYLVGDSNAAMHDQGVLEAARALGSPLYVSTAADCPYVDIYRKSQWGDVADRACRDFVDKTTAWLTTAPHGTVLIAGSMRYGFESTYELGATPQSVSNDVNARVSSLRKGLVSTINELKSAGQQVVLFAPTYKFEDWATPVTIERCPTFRILNGSCPITLPVSDIDTGQSETRQAFLDAARIEHVPVVDLLPFQCDQGHCADRFRGTWIYDDPSHISASLSRLTTPEIISAIRAARG